MGVSSAAALALNASAGFSITGVSVIVTVPHGPGSSKLLGQAGSPAGPASSSSLTGAPGRALLRAAAAADRAPSAAAAAPNEFVAVALMSEWLAFHFPPRTAFPDPFLRGQTKFRQKRRYSFLD